jgi:hypothetical protein
MTAVYGCRHFCLPNDIAENALFDKNISTDDMVEHAFKAGRDMLFGSAGLLGLNFLTNTIKGKPVTPLEKAHLWELGDKPDIGMAKIDEAVANNEITKQQGEQRKEAITQVAALIDKVPTVNKEGKPMSDAQRIDYLYNEFIKSKSSEAKKDLPKAQANELTQKELQADHENNIIYTDQSLPELEKRKKQLEKELEPKKDADGNEIKLPEKELLDLNAELDAVNSAISKASKEESVEEVVIH